MLQTQLDTLQQQLTQRQQQLREERQKQAEKAAAREEREDGLTATAKASRNASQALAGDPWSEWQAPEPAL